jgi:hypothetical protein
VRHSIAHELNERALDRFDHMGVEPYVAAPALEFHVFGCFPGDISYRAFESREEACRRAQPEPFRGVAQLA